MRRNRRTKLISDSSPDYLVVGLGNPGKKYQGTRHNIGAEVIYVLEEQHGVLLRKNKAHALCAEVKSENLSLVIAVPETYMNESGLAVRMLMDRYNLAEPKRLVIVHDELDLPVGKIKIKLGGGFAGHNGLKSIESHIHSRDFTRIRVGIGPVQEGRKGRDYVLSRPGKDEKQGLLDAKILAGEAIEFLQRHGHQASMNKFNT